MTTTSEVIARMMKMPETPAIKTKSAVPKMFIESLDSDFDGQPEQSQRTIWVESWS
ncbi:MAG: hypothetical protein QF699_03490 [Candidatus Poseidoniaceae archaeon]|nr:hypothetical protein [Candidatus Poseidoniaceae archaeon]